APLDGSQSRVQLLPAGMFRAADGRPTDAPGWQLNALQAARVMADADARTNDFMFDFEHQTIHCEKNGQPNPAAGWFKQLEFDPEKGLFAADVRWTSRALQMIESGEYRYVSALFLYDLQGNIVRLINAALTNTPALDGMNELLAAASLIYINQEETQMDEQLRIALCSMLGLAKDADEAAIAVALTDAQEKLLNPAACSTFAELVSKKDLSIAALSQSTKTPSTPDPSQYAPVAVVDDLRTQLAALSQKVSQSEADALIEAALSDGRIITGADEKWMRDLAAKDMSLFKAGLSTRKPNPALTRTQTRGQAPTETNAAALSVDQKKLLGSMGLGDDYLTEKEKTS
ncbi:phage protease, partial [Rahnella sp. ChDrAdgB13]|uniref:phage protease n=1 Tax=Rahnella sp. ChDrAdgB13 TaxID=1850581 RepID=UPI001AD87FB5